MSSSVVIVGGGYAGISVAQALDADADVTLVDPRDSFVNVSASLRALAQREWAERPFFAYRSLLTHGRVLGATVTAADPTGVTLATGEHVEADHLVLATGSSYPFPAHPRNGTVAAAEAVRDLHDTREQLARAERVLILGAGPVGLELSGEIGEAWPEKHITVLDRSAQLLPGFLPELRHQLHRQLTQRGVELILGTSLAVPPTTGAGIAETFAVTTDTGRSITADIWFPSYGARVNTDYLRDGALVELTERRTVPVDEHLNVVGHQNVYALGDIADLPDAKQATHAQTQAPVVVDNIRARLHGRQPTATYRPADAPRIFLPLGTRGGVGQIPGPDGAAIAAPVELVIERKGTDLFTSRFAERFARAG